MPKRGTVRGDLTTVSMTVVSLLMLTGCKPTNQFAPPPPPKVAVAAPTQQKITQYVEATGNAAPVNDVDLVARINGFLQDIGYQDGAMVKKGDMLFTVEPQPYLVKLQQAQAQQEATAAQLKQAESEYFRQSTLGRQDFASQSAVDQALAKRDALRATLKEAQANTEEAGINYTYTHVKAPFDGKVSAHLVSIGEYVGGTTPTKLAQIVQIDPIWVNFSLSEQDVQRIRAMIAKKEVKVDPVGKVPVEVGLQTETGYPHPGVLDYVAPTVDQSTGTLALRGVFKNSDLALLPGYYVRVRVPIEQDIPALLIPDSCIGFDQLGNYVYVVNAQSVVEQRRITTGLLVGTNRQITQGITADDKVIVAGVQRAVPGQKVTAETAQPATAR